ncbi:MAG: cytochrome c [Nitrosomonadales bacterium]|nr:cytochrome c [Nitrosomonadales bacterium]
MNRKWMFAISFLWLVYPACAAVQINPSRGELLYTTHCIACHSAEIHWRDKTLATDWTSLKKQVDRWQGIAGLGWRADDIAQVARYLNTLYYHYPETTEKSGPASNSTRAAPLPDQRPK